jgi:hypothetical protein
VQDWPEIFKKLFGKLLLYINYMYLFIIYNLATVGESDVNLSPLAPIRLWKTHEYYQPLLPIPQHNVHATDPANPLKTNIIVKNAG